MSDCLIVGRPNVGKTSFVINFAEYMGLEKLKIHVKQPAGYTSIKKYMIKDARNILVSEKPNFTKNIQIIKIEIPAGKITKTLKLIDSCGLENGIHSDENIRKSMAVTLKKITKTKLILHIIDINQLIENIDNKKILTAIDKMIYKYTKIDKNYAILLNKIDLINSFKNKFNLIRQKLDFEYVIPISAVNQTGFQKVKKMVLNYV